MAIEWVYDNIRYFGGDETNINIWGISAGAISVGLHLLYNHDHIASGIMQSPLFILPQKDHDSWGDMVATFSDLIGCDDHDQNATQLLACWRSVDAADILDAQTDGSLRGLRPFPFTPTAGTDVIPDQAMTALQEMDTPPFILGVVADEFYHFMPSMPPSYDTFITASVAMNLFFEDPVVVNAVFDFYGLSPTNSLSGSYIIDYVGIVNDGVC